MGKKLEPTVSTCDYSVNSNEFGFTEMSTTEPERLLIKILPSS
jgi:hypothetical protein